MADGCVIFTKAEELIEWLDENDILMNLADKEAGLILSYMESNGYCIGASGDKLFRVDKSEPGLQPELYSIDDMIDTVFDWNYELKSEADKARRNPVSFIDFCEKQDRYESLVEDERMIEKMFDRTVYGKAITSALQKASLIK